MRRRKANVSLVAALLLTMLSSAALPASGQTAAAASQDQTQQAVTPDPEPLPEQQPAECIQFDFRGASLRTVVRFVAQLSNLVPIIPESLVGVVTISSPRRLSLSDAQRVLGAVLDAYEFTLLRDDHFLRVVPKAVSMQRSVDLFYGRDLDAIPADDRIITQIIPVENARAAGIVDSLTPLISTTGHMFVSAENNMLGITDSASNVRRLLGIILHLDVERAAVSSTYTRVYNIHYLKAEEVATALQAVFGGGTAATTTGSAGTAAATTAPAAAPPSTLGSLAAVANPATPAAQSTASPASVPNQGTRITPVIAANAIIVTAMREIHRQIEDTLLALDTRRRQVLIEVKIIEGTLSRETSTGINLLEFIFATGAGLHTITGGADTSSPYVNYTLNSNQLDVVLTAAAADDTIRILSAPHVLTSDNQQARIVVAQEEPILTSVTDLAAQTAGPRTVSSFEYRDVGIELTVTPRINEDRDVDLEVDFNITSLLANVALPGETFAPRIGKREGSSKVTVMDGSTLVIGGLMKDDYRDQRQKVPILGSIPIIGRLFSTVRQVKDQTELLVLVTPRVAETDAEGVRLTREAEEGMEARFPDARTKSESETAKEQQPQEQQR